MFNDVPSRSTTSHSAALGVHFQQAQQRAQASELPGIMTVTNSPRFSQYSKGQNLVEETSVDQTGAKSQPEKPAIFYPFGFNPHTGGHPGEDAKVYSEARGPD